MTQTIRRFGLGIGAGLMALGLGAAVLASPQDTAPNPPPFSGRAMRGPGGPGMRGGFGELRMLRQLNLTDAQKQQIRGVMQSHSAELKSLGDRMAQARQALDKLINADTIDEGAIRDASTAVAAVEADMAVARAHIRAEVLQVLTPDQQAKAKQLEAQMQERMSQMRQRLQNRANGQK